MDDLNIVDFVFGGSTLHMLATKDTSGKDYLVTTFPGTDIVLVVKHHEYTKNTSEYGYHFERFVTERFVTGGRFEDKHEEQTVEHMQLMLLNKKYRVLFSAEYDGVGSTGHPVEVKASNPDYWGSKVMLQMISNGSTSLVVGYKSHHTLCHVETKPLSQVINTALEKETLSLLEGNIQSGLDYLNEQFKSEKFSDGSVWKINFDAQGSEHKMTLTYFCKNQNQLLPPTHIILELLKSSRIGNDKARKEENEDDNNLKTSPSDAATTTTTNDTIKEVELQYEIHSTKNKERKYYEETIKNSLRDSNSNQSPNQSAPDTPRQKKKQNERMIPKQSASHKPTRQQQKRKGKGIKYVHVMLSAPEALPCRQTPKRKRNRPKFYGEATPASNSTPCQRQKQIGSNLIASNEPVNAAKKNKKNKCKLCYLGSTYCNANHDNNYVLTKCEKCRNMIHKDYNWCSILNEDSMLYWCVPCYKKHCLD